MLRRPPGVLSEQRALTTAQLAGIYQGTITNWSTVGGA